VQTPTGFVLIIYRKEVGNFLCGVLTFIPVGYIMNIEKGKTSNGYAKVGYYCKNNRTLAGGGYFTFIVNVIKNTIVRNNILSMYTITTTSSRSVA